MRLRLIPCRSPTAVIEARGCDASSRIATFSSIVQRRRRATVLMISTRLSITVLMTAHKDAKTHDSPSAPQGRRQTTLTRKTLGRQMLPEHSARGVPLGHHPEFAICRLF